MKKNRGITLAEIIVASFVMSILLAVSVKVMIPALRAWSDGQKRSEVSQGILVTANWIADDMIRSQPNSLEVNDEGIFVMRCTRGAQTDESNDFSEMVAYWLDGDDLFRGSRTAGPESGPPVVTLAEMGAINTKRRVASGVETFDVEVVQKWRITLHLVVKKGERNAEIKTSYSSVYAPLDPNVAEQEVGG